MSNLYVYLLIYYIISSIIIGFINYRATWYYFEFSKAPISTFFIALCSCLLNIFGLVMIYVLSERYKNGLGVYKNTKFKCEECNSILRTTKIITFNRYIEGYYIDCYKCGERNIFKIPEYIPEEQWRKYLDMKNDM